jgi:hypothetical protein
MELERAHRNEARRLKQDLEDQDERHRLERERAAKRQGPARSIAFDCSCITVPARATVLSHGKKSHALRHDRHGIRHTPNIRRTPCIRRTRGQRQSRGTGQNTSHTADIEYTPRACRSQRHKLIGEVEAHQLELKELRQAAYQARQPALAWLPMPHTPWRGAATTYITCCAQTWWRTVGTVRPGCRWTDSVFVTGCVLRHDANAS